MSLETVVIALALLGTLIASVLAVLFWFKPEKGMAMAMAHHRLEFLPRVMADRYAGMVLIVLAALIRGDMGIIAFVSFVLAGTALADTYIYCRAGHSYGPHLSAGVIGLAVSGLAMVAPFKGAL